MEGFFDIEKLEKYKGWLKKINKYFNYERVTLIKLWKFLSEQLSFNEGQYYDLKLALMFLYDNFIRSGNDDDSIDMIEYVDVERLLVDGLGSNYEDKQMVLSELLDIPAFLLSDQGYSHYGDGLTFNDLTSGLEYVVYDEDEVDEAYDEWKDTYVSESYLDELYDIEDYIDIDMDSYVMRELIETQVDDMMDNYSEDEILERSGYDHVKSELIEDIENFEQRLEDIESEIEDLNDNIDTIESEIQDYINDNDEGDYDDEIEELEYSLESIRSDISDKESEMEDIESQKEYKQDELDNVLEEATDELKETLESDITYDIEQDPLDYLNSNLGLSYSDIIDYGYGDFEKDRYIDDMFDDYERGDNLGTGREEEIDYDGVTYFIYEL
jgi:predicted  nucleic acid-binding Zn-ribbon protein